MLSRRTVVALLGTLLCFLPRTAQAEESSKVEALPEFNRIVLDLIKEYPTDGTHDYWWPRLEEINEINYDGCTQDLFFRNQKAMKGEPGRRTYCCGLTLEVFLRAYKKWLDRHGGEEKATLTAEDWPQFKKLWFVLEQNGPGPSAAAEAYHLGRTILREEALPGDFVQIWRTKNPKGKTTGHSVIFLDWTRDESDSITGFRYWSTQPATNGIAERVEHYGPRGGISEEYTYFCRVEPETSSKADIEPIAGVGTE